MDNIREEYLSQVIELVSKVTNVPVADIKGPSRERHISDARKMFCTYVYTQKEVPFKMEEVAQYVGVTHSAISSYKKRVDDYCFSNKVFNNQYNTILESINTSQVFKELISRIKKTGTVISAGDIEASIDLIKEKIKLMETWLQTHAVNVYRPIILRDLREAEIELQSKTATLQELQPLNNQ